MKSYYQLIGIVFIILCHGFLQTQITQAEQNAPVENLNIGMTTYESDSGAISVSMIQEALEKSLHNYYRLNIRVVPFDNYTDLLDQIDLEQELFIKHFLQEKNLDYLIYIRNRRNIELWLEVWNKAGIIENIGLPFSSKIEAELVNIATNLFLSIIESLDNRLYIKKLF